jgi:hypothetical protein
MATYLSPIYYHLNRQNKTLIFYRFITLHNNVSFNEIINKQKAKKTKKFLK